MKKPYAYDLNRQSTVPYTRRSAVADTPREAADNPVR